jgi:hypothetical protein
MNCYMKACTTLVCLLTVNLLFGQATDFVEPDPHRRELMAVKITGSIHVDGLLTEPEWAWTRLQAHLRSRALALNPRVQFTGIYQRNSLNHSDNYNLRLAWEFQPLSYVYLIYNRGVNSQLSQPVAKTQTEDDIIFKASYLKQF